jgi:hypothetical protein
MFYYVKFNSIGFSQGSMLAFKKQKENDKNLLINLNSMVLYISLIFFFCTFAMIF